jgi:hypothetical protein
MAKKSKDEDGPKFEYVFTLGDKHKLSVSVFKNQDDKPVLNLRKFYLSSEDEWRPDRQGLTMHFEQVTKLRKALKLLEEVADDAPEADFGDKKKKGKKDKNDDAKGKKSKSKKAKDEDEDDDD